MEQWYGGSLTCNGEGGELSLAIGSVSRTRSVLLVGRPVTMA